MDLAQRLEKCRPRLLDVPIDRWTIDVSGSKLDVAGAVAEQLVEFWLKDSGLVTQQDIPEDSEDYLVARKGSNLVVYSLETGDTLHEFDGIVEYLQRPYVVEVKSQRLNGISGKIPRGLKIASELTGHDDPGFLLFMPLYANKIRDAKRLEEMFPQLRCVDLGYTRRQKDMLVERLTTEDNVYIHAP